MLEDIRVQGDLVRKLKAQKAPKEEVRHPCTHRNVLPRH